MFRQNPGPDRAQWEAYEEARGDLEAAEVQLVAARNNERVLEFTLVRGGGVP